MKKLSVLFIIFYLAINQAQAKKPKIDIMPTPEGRSVRVDITEKQAEFGIDFSDKGEIEFFQIYFLKNKATYLYKLYYSFGKARVLRFTAWIKNDVFYGSYTKYKHKRLLQYIDGIKRRFVKKYRLKKLAIKACAKQKAKYRKRKRMQKEQEKKRQAKMPDPKKTLEDNIDL